MLYLKKLIPNTVPSGVCSPIQLYLEQAFP